MLSCCAKVPVDKLPFFDLDADTDPDTDTFADAAFAVYLSNCLVVNGPNALGE